MKALRCLHEVPGPSFAHWGVFSTLERITAWNFGAGSWVDWIMFAQRGHEGERAAQIRGAAKDTVRSDSIWCSGSLKVHHRTVLDAGQTKSCGPKWPGKIEKHDNRPERLSVVESVKFRALSANERRLVCVRFYVNNPPKHRRRSDLIRSEARYEPMAFKKMAQDGRRAPTP